MDKKLLLVLQYICNAEGIKMPWDKVAAIMGPTISDGAVVQHLAKLRQRMIAAGLSVPPPLKRGGGYVVNADPGVGPSTLKNVKKLPALKSPDSETDGEDDEDIFDAEETSSFETQPKRAKHDSKDKSHNSKGTKADSDEDVTDKEETSDEEDVAAQKNYKLAKQEPKGKGRDIKGKKPEWYVEETSGVEEGLLQPKTNLAKNQPKGKNYNRGDRKIATQEEEMVVSSKVGEKRKRQRGNTASILKKGKNKERAKTPTLPRARRSTINYGKLSKADSDGPDNGNDGDYAEYVEGDDSYVAVGADFLKLEELETASAVQSKIVTLKLGKSERAKQFLRGLDNEGGIVTDLNEVSETGSEDESMTGAMDGVSSVNGTTMIQGFQGFQNMDGPTEHEDFGPSRTSGNRSYQSSTNIASMGAAPLTPHTPRTAQAGAGEQFHPAPYAYPNNGSGYMPPTTHFPQAVAGGASHHISDAGFTSNSVNTAWVQRKAHLRAELIRCTNALADLDSAPQATGAVAPAAFYQPQYPGFDITFGNAGRIPSTPQSGVAPSLQQSPGVNSINGSGSMGPAPYTPRSGAGEVVNSATNLFNQSSPTVPNNYALNPSTRASGNAAFSSAQEGGEGLSNNIGVVDNMATSWNNGSGYPTNSAVLQNVSSSQNHGTSAGSAHGMTVNNFPNWEADQPNHNHYHGYSENDLSNTQNSSPGVQEPLEQHGSPGAAYQFNSTRVLPGSSPSSANYFPNANLPSNFAGSIDDDMPFGGMHMLPPNDFFVDFLNPHFNQDDRGFRGA